MNGRIIALLISTAANGGPNPMSISAKLMAIYHVRQDNGCWGVMRGREASFGYFRQKADAIQCALDEARSHTPSLVSIELADGRIEGEIRLGLVESQPA